MVVAEIEVVNVVGTITFQQELALDALSEVFIDQNEIASVRYEPTEDYWLQTWFAPDETYVVFYRKGRCSIIGCNSIDHFDEVVGRVNEVMRDLLQFEYEPKAEISYIVATADIGTSIPLELAILEFGMNRVEYEPEQFPALIYRGEGYIIFVFASGKLLCTGLSDLDDATDAIEDMISQLQPFI